MSSIRRLVFTQKLSDTSSARVIPSLRSNLASSMTSFFGSPTTLSPKHLSNGLVRQVLPRAPASRHQAQADSVAAPFQETPRTADAIPGVPNGMKPGDNTPFTWSEGRKRNPLSAENSPTVSRSLGDQKATFKRTYSKYYNTQIRRQQCRTNQARYRNRQRDYQLKLEQSVEKLHQELDSLNRRRQDLHFREKNNRSPWTVVADVFNLIETCFRSPWHLGNTKEMAGDTECLTAVESSFMSDVYMGDICGVKGLMQQLQRYSQYFGAPRIQLQRVEMVAPNVLRTSARLSLTITELTLRHVFPQISKAPRSKYDTDWGLQIVGQRIDCSCSLVFLFDDKSGRVARLETKIDLMAAMLGILGGLEAVSKVLQGALVTPECTISEIAN